MCLMRALALAPASGVATHPKIQNYHVSSHVTREIQDDKYGLMPIINQTDEVHQPPTPSTSPRDANLSKAHAISNY